MNDDPFVFAMANPNPEVTPEEAAPYVRVMATGPVGLPQPDQQRAGLPRDLPRRAGRRARRPITEEMKLAAARGIASTVADDELASDYIIPSVFNREVSRKVAQAVAEEAERTGADPVAGRHRRILRSPARGASR